VTRLAPNRPSPRIPSLLALALSIAACGGKQAEPPPQSALDVSARGEALPPVPQNPLHVLPAEASELVSVDLQRLRASPHYPMAEQWLRRFACTQPEPQHFLLERTERVVLATYRVGPSGDVPQPLAVLRGAYREGDVERALSQARVWLGVQPAEVTEQVSGRFRLLQAGELSGVQLGDGMIVVGHPDRVQAVLEVVDGRRTALDATVEIMGGIHTAQWLDSHAAAAITRIDERTAQRLGRGLSAIGGRRLGEDLSQSSAAVGLVLAGDLELRAHVLYRDARTAAEAASGLRSVLGRADLVLRITGMPSVIERVLVTAQGERLDAVLKLPSDDVRSLTTRLELMLEGTTPTCGTLSKKTHEPEGPTARVQDDATPYGEQLGS
jgi:hypothetical protein